VGSVSPTELFLQHNRRTGRIYAIQEHEAPRRLQTKLLLILKRTHRRECPEMMVQRGHTHACDLCEFFDS